jgi:ADP-ribosylglycohydrolase
MKSPNEPILSADVADLAQDERGTETGDVGDSGSDARRGPFRAGERITGMLLGGAIGDALGMPVECVDNDATLRALHRLGGVRDFLAPQPNVLRTLQKLRPGCWTDDTQLTLSACRSLVASGGIDYDAIAAGWVKTFETMELRGWDATTKQACRRLQQGTSRHRSGKLGGSGNAVATRIAPVAAWSFVRGESREVLLQHCLELGLLSHNDSRAIVGAYVVALLVQEALRAPRRWEPLPSLYEQLVEQAEWAEAEITSRVGCNDDPISRHLHEVSDALDSDSVELAELCNGATSYACHSIPYVAALVCGRAWEFEDAVVAAVNGGGDTDSNTAMVGSIIGAALGNRRLPRRFLDKLEETEMIREIGASMAGALG